MVRPGRGAWRVRRGLALAACCALLSCAGHVVGGGHLPDPGPVLLVGLLISAGCVAWADRRRNAAEIVAVLLLSQPLLHMSMASHHAAAAGAPPATAPDARMVLAHTAAAVALGTLLAGAEALIWSRAAAAALRPVPLRLLAQLLGAVAPAVPGRARVHPTALAAVATPVEVARRPSRRGPPALLA